MKLRIAKKIVRRHINTYIKTGKTKSDLFDHCGHRRCTWRRAAARVNIQFVLDTLKDAELAAGFTVATI